MPSLTAANASRMNAMTSRTGGMRPLNTSTDRATTAIPYARVDRSKKTGRRS